VLIAALAHASLNYVTGSPVGDQTIAAVVSTVIMVWAVTVVAVWRPATLAPGRKHVVPAGGSTS
jgi:hypothetical protein